MNKVFNEFLVHTAQIDSDLTKIYIQLADLKKEIKTTNELVNGKFIRMGLGFENESK